MSKSLIPQVLTDTDHCYCVLLNAYDGAAFPSERNTEQPSSDIPSSENVSTAGKIKNSKVVYGESKQFS